MIALSADTIAPGFGCEKTCLPIHTPPPPACIALYTVVRVSSVLEPAGPPAISTGMGTDEVTLRNESIEPVHLVLTTLHPNSNASLAA